MAHHKGKRKRTAPVSVTVKGILDITRSGVGFVQVSGQDRDIMVRPGDFNRAFHGDTVLVQVSNNHGHTQRRMGRVVDVVSRKQTDFVGTLRTHAGRWFFIPDSDKPLPSFDLEPGGDIQMNDEDRAVVKMVEWRNDAKRPTGKLMRIMEPESLNEIAMQDILLENGFPLSFSDEAMETAMRLPEHISSDELKRRRDLREVLTFTIDPVDARDFDDALSLQNLPNGDLEIGVHIADVSHFVEKGSPLDEEAYQRATSVYLPDRVNPMLPERISNELCSLRPHEDKYTFSAIFELSPQGDIRKYWLGRTVIHSNHRFTYEEVQLMIEGADGPYREEVLVLNQLARRMRSERFQQGAIHFSSQEVRFRLDEAAVPVEVVVKESKEAHQLIEEFMLLANKTVARHVSNVVVKDKPLPFPFRVHDTPDEAKLQPFMAFAKKMGYAFDTRSPESIAQSFNSMLEQAKGTPQQHVLEQLGIRTMAKAVYTAENIGHYGLGFEHYCHFTSPIRRYPDVMVHRILQEVLDHKPQLHKKMEEQCKHCSERERAAMDCERSANKYKQVEFMSKYLGETFPAVITGVSTFGFWAETVAHKCEGLVSMRDLSDYDEFMLIESDYSLAGLRSGRKFRMGDTVTIQVVAANLEKRQLDYGWVPQHLEEDPKAGQSAKTATKSKPRRTAGPEPKKSKRR